MYVAAQNLNATLERGFQVPAKVTQVSGNKTDQECDV
jgi:hypothetical protein